MTAQTESPADTQAVPIIGSQDEFDEAIWQLGHLDDEVQSLLLQRSRAVRRVEARFASKLMPKLVRQQALFNAIKQFAENNRIRLLPRGSKTSHRSTGE